MRTSKIDIIVKSNTDLSELSNSRIIIEKVDSETFSIKSLFNVYKCEAHSVIYKFIKSRLSLKYTTGNCSTPTGYFI